MPSIPLFVTNGTPYAWVKVPCTALIPFAESDAQQNLDAAQVMNSAGQAIPCQFKVLARYGIGKTRDDSSAPIRFAQAVFPGSVPGATHAGRVAGRAEFTLKLHHSQALRGGLSLTESEDTITIQSGVYSWTLDRSAMSVFREVKVGGKLVNPTPGKVDLELAEGQKIPKGVTTTIVERGGYRIEILQSGLIESRRDGDVRLHLRYVFHDGSPEVVLSTRIAQEREWKHQSNRRNEYLKHFYLHLPVAHDDKLKVTSAVGTEAVNDQEAWRLHQRMRELSSFQSNGIDNRSVRPAGWPPEAKAPQNHQHLLSFKIGKTGKEQDYPERQYIAGVHVGGGAGIGVAVAMEAFSKKAPSEYQVSDGALRIGMFPDGIPGDEHFRGWAFRGTYENGIVYEKRAEHRPKGLNPITQKPWANGDYAPVGFPMRHPPVGGACPTTENEPQGKTVGHTWRYVIRARWRNAKGQGNYTVTIPNGQRFAEYKPEFESAHPGRFLYLEREGWEFLGSVAPVDPQSIDFYRLQPGMWFVDRVVLRFDPPANSARTPPDAYELAGLQTQVDAPAAGMAHPSRFVKTRAFGGWMWTETLPRISQGNAAHGHPDVDLWERWPDLVVDPLTADPQGGSGALSVTDKTGRYVGYQEIMERGSSRPGECLRRTVGWDYYGLLWWEGQQSSNNHYDQAAYVMLQFLRRGDPRFLKVARPLAHHAIHRGMIHGTTAEGYGEFVGGSFYESGSWLGMEPKYPNSSHTWARTNGLYYLIYGDEDARRSLEERALWWTRRNHGQSPMGWKGRSGLRVPGWGIEGLTDIYVMLGDIPGWEGRRVMGEATRAIELIMDYESNVMGLDRTPVADGGKPLNFIPASQARSDEDVVLPNRGFVLNRLGDGNRGGNAHFSQTWLHMIYFCAAAYHLMSRPDAKSDAPRFRHIYTHLARMRDFLRSSTTYDPSRYVTQIPRLWFPPEHKKTSDVSNYLGVWHAADAFAYAHFLFKGSEFFKSEDYTEAKHVFFGANRYHQRGYTKLNAPIPKGENYGDPTPQTFSADGVPMPGAQIHNRSLWFSQGGQQVPKFFMQDHMRRAYATLAAMRDRGEVGPPRKK